MTTVNDILSSLNNIAPYATQEEWDNSGFLIGDLKKDVDKVVLSLDITEGVVDFAVSVGADLIISHHPVIFGRVSKIEQDSVLHRLIVNGIAVISCHTNLDKAPGGVNDSLCTVLGLKRPRRLVDGYTTVGELETPMSIDDFAAFVADTLESKGLTYTDTEKLIKKVALSSGSGSSEFITNAMENADVFLTGEIKYHDMLEAAEKKYPVICAGHFETEYKPAILAFQQLAEIYPDIEFFDSNQVNPLLEL